MSENEEKPIEILVVGAGNIGRVYGYHLFKAGCKIHYYVREHNKQKLTNYPLRVHRLTSAIRFLNNSTTKKFSEYTITTDSDIANGNAPNLPEHLDYVVFAVPTYRLPEGDWLKTLITFLNNKYQKNVYYTSPIPDETGMQRFIDMGIDKTQIIAGQTNTCSFFAPLANQRFEPRGKEIAKKDNEEDNPNKVIIYCTTFPETYGELTKEAKEATDKFVDLLKKGELPAQNIGKDTQYGILGLFATPVFLTFPKYNYDLFKAGRDMNTMVLVMAAFSEVALIIEKKTENNCSFMIKLIPFIPTSLFCLALIIAHFFLVLVWSFDFEAFCNAHFNVKLGVQAEFFANVIKSEAEKYSVDTTNLNKLLNNFNTNFKKNE